ncbi:MAG: phosphate/phosphite/phosphonate ABC transporter substrate-binding protein [Anaerolineae bacterium]|nr:phosphate/phosphite/phosphonate ABC transporter substrate-binding protein [Anaerolineae bacterium]
MAFVPSSDRPRSCSVVKSINRCEADRALSFKVSVPTSYAAVVEAMNAGQIDVAWLAPTSYVAANNRYGVELLLTTMRNGSKVFSFSIIVAADSFIKTVADLGVAKIARFDPLSTSNPLPFAPSVSQGIDPNKDVQWVYSGGHDKSIIALVNGQVDAAVVFGEYKGTPDARDRVKGTIPDVMQKTRVLLNSESVNAMIQRHGQRAVTPGRRPEDQRSAMASSPSPHRGRHHELQALYQITGLDVGNLCRLRAHPGGRHRQYRPGRGHRAAAHPRPATAAFCRAVAGGHGCRNVTQT